MFKITIKIFKTLKNEINPEIGVCENSHKFECFKKIGKLPSRPQSCFSGMVGLLLI